MKLEGTGKTMETMGHRAELLDIPTSAASLTEACNSMRESQASLHDGGCTASRVPAAQQEGLSRRTTWKDGRCLRWDTRINI